jgi:hypothetical protein
VAAQVIESMCAGGAAEVRTALRAGAAVDATGLLRVLLDEANRA